MLGAARACGEKARIRASQIALAVILAECGNPEALHAAVLVRYAPDL
jgi:hypothetical protein